MAQAPIVALATELAAADPETCDQAGLTHLVTLSQRARGWLDAFDGRIAQAGARLAEQGEGEGPSALLAGGGRRAARDAEAAARRGATCGLLPGLHEALAAGEVSAGHADAVAWLAGELDDAGRAELCDLQATIVAKAQSSSVEAFGREMRDLGRVLSGDEGVSRHERMRKARYRQRWVDRDTGMCITRLALDPETDAAVSAASDGAVATARTEDQTGDDRTFDPLRADALVGLITGNDQTSKEAGGVSVLIDLDTLRHGLHDHWVCETADGQPLPPETVRRLCCDAEIIPIVLNGDGIPVDIGRSARLANRAQRRALRAMYRTCAHPGCTVRFADCRIHHVVDWFHDGPSDLANLIPLCSRDHHLVHEGGWTLILHPDRTISLARPDGVITYHGTTVDVAPAGTATPTADPSDAAPAAQLDAPMPSSLEQLLHPDDEPLDASTDQDDAPFDPADVEARILAALARHRLRNLGPPARAPAA